MSNLYLKLPTKRFKRISEKLLPKKVHVIHLFWYDYGTQ